MKPVSVQLYHLSAVTLPAEWLRDGRLSLSEGPVTIELLTYGSSEYKGTTSASLRFKMSWPPLLKIREEP